MSDIIEIRRVGQTDWRQYLMVDGEWRESGALTLGVGFASSIDFVLDTLMFQVPGADTFDVRIVLSPRQHEETPK